MRRHPRHFTPRAVEHVRRAILSTQVEVVGVRLLQKVIPGDTMATALADADLAWFGGPACLHRSVMLELEEQMREGRWQPGVNAPDLPKLRVSLQFSSVLVAGHRYHLKVSRDLFGAGRRANARLISDVVAGTPAGAAALTSVVAAACQAGRLLRAGGRGLG